MTLVRRYDCPARRDGRASPAAAHFNALRLMPPTLEFSGSLVCLEIDFFSAIIVVCRLICS